MRDYATVRPSFWTGKTGRDLRAAGRDAQVLALYLFTGPTAYVLGIYYLPVPTASHDTGLSRPATIRALAKLEEAGFAYYDFETEQVWVPQMAGYQMAEEIQTNDKRHGWVISEVQKLAKSKFYKDFLSEYGQRFHLPALLIKEGAPKGLHSPSIDPPETLRSHRTGSGTEIRSREQEQDQNPEQPPARLTPGSIYPPGFSLAWSAYPHYGQRRKKAKALAVWKRDQLEPQADSVLAWIASAAASDEWERESGKYVPALEVWLNGRDFSEPPPPPKRNLLSSPEETTMRSLALLTGRRKLT